MPPNMTKWIALILLIGLMGWVMSSLKTPPTGPTQESQKEARFNPAVDCASTSEGCGGVPAK